jgi:hypothetical protein
MALINLKTNLLTLKYGGDKLKGGSSNQPYITTPIPGLQSDGNVASVGVEDNPPFDILAARFPDALVRGGLLAPINAGKDVSRLTQYFFDLKSPRGLIFIANQNLLSRTAVKTEASYGAGYGGGALNEGIYLPTSTLAQVAVQGWTGTHLNKQGLNPFTPTGVNTDTGSRLLNTLLSAGGINLYSDVVKQNNLEENNQFPALKKNIEYQSPKPVTDRFGPEIDPILPIVTYSLEGGYKNRLLNIWYNKQLGTDGSNNILSYGGGPGSALGIGKTNIQFSDQRTGDRNTNFNQPYFRGKGNRSYRDPDSPEYIDITRKLGVSNTPIFLKQFLDPSISARGDNSILGFDIDTGNQTSNNPFGFKQEPANQTLSTIKSINGKDPNNYLKTPSRTYTNSDQTKIISPKLGASIAYSGSIRINLVNPEKIDIGFDSNGNPTSNNPFSFKQEPANQTLSTVSNLSNYTIANRTPQDESIVPKLGASIDYKNKFGQDIDYGFDPTTNNPTSNNPFSFKQAPANQTLSTLDKSSPGYIFNQTQINNSTPIQDGKSTLVDDFRTKLNIENNKTILSFSPNYGAGPGKKDNIEQRVNLGDPGSRKDRPDYTLGGIGGFGNENNIKNALDKITAQPIYLGSYKKLDTASGGATTLKDPNSLNDLATFYIAAYKNDTSSNAFYMHFRAFINSFSDSYSPKWNSNQLCR